MNLYIHKKISDYYGLTQSMKINMSPKTIVDIMSNYFGVNIEKKSTETTSRVLRQVAMKILIENYGLDHQTTASVLKCGRSNVTQMYNKINSIIDVDEISKNIYRLTLNLIINKLSEHKNQL